MFCGMPEEQVANHLAAQTFWNTHIEVLQVGDSLDIPALTFNQTECTNVSISTLEKTVAYNSYKIELWKSCLISKRMIVVTDVSRKILSLKQE